MKDLHFKNNHDLDEFLSTAKRFDNQGVEGVVYKKDSTVIKDFRPTRGICKDDILEFRDLEISDFYFAKAGIYIRMKLRACITEYAPGLTLDERNIFAENVKTVLGAVERLENAVKELSTNGIRADDVHAKNVLFNQDHFNIIDTTYYLYSSMEYDDIYSLNIRHIMRNISKKILPKDLYWFLITLRSVDAAYYFPHSSLVMLTEYLEKMIGHFESFAEAQDIIDKQNIILPLR